MNKPDYTPTSGDHAEITAPMHRDLRQMIEALELKDKARFIAAKGKLREALDKLDAWEA